MCFRVTAPYHSRNWACHGPGIMENGVAESTTDRFDIITLAYEVALDASLRPLLLDKIRAYLSADAIVWLAGSGADPDTPASLLQCGLDPAKMGAYARLGWSSPLLPGMLRAPPCEPLTNRMLVAPGELERSDFYQHWVRPNNVAGTGLIAVLAPLSGPTVILSAMREKSAGRVQFDNDNSVELYRPILSYIARAAALAERIGRVIEASQSAADIPNAALGVFRIAMMCLDARLQIVWMNRAAEAMMHRCDGLKVARNGGLIADTSRETERLQTALQRAAFGKGESLQLHRVSGAGTLSLIAVPYRAYGRLANECAPAAPKVLVFVFDMADGLDAPRWVTQERLRSIYQFTATEAMICIYIAGGAGIPAVARALRLEQSTVRTHTKQIFSKTSVHSQTQLARLVARLAIIDSH